MLFAASAVSQALYIRHSALQSARLLPRQCSYAIGVFNFADVISNAFTIIKALHIYVKDYFERAKQWRNRTR
jgi:hypothetical protein